MAISLGAVTSTNVWVKSVKLTWTNFTRGWVYTDQTSIQPANVYSARMEAPFAPKKHPNQATSYYWSIGKRFGFNNTDNQLMFEHIDAWPEFGSQICNATFRVWAIPRADPL